MIPKRIAAIGASYCEGKVDPEGGGVVGRLRSWHESFIQDNHVFNLGISGDTTSDMLKRLEKEMKPRKPDLILVVGGLNDFIRRESKIAKPDNTVEGYEKNIRDLIAKAKNLAPVLFVGVQPVDEARTAPVSWENIYYLLSDAKTATDITKKVCLEMKVPYVDVFGEFMKIDYKKYLADGLHPNSQGHQRIFELVKDKLIGVYGKN